MKKRILSTFLCAVMVTAAVLTGCSSGKESTPPPEESKVQSSAPVGGDETTPEGGESGGAESQTSLPPLTEDEITLTYMTFDNKVLTEWLAEKFTELHPNIKVNVIFQSTTNDYNNTLLNLVSTGQTPDCFMILDNCDFALSNGLFGDMTEYWENDPENDNILPSINGAKLGYYGTAQKLATPIKFFPCTIFADMAVFEKLNVEMPPTDWTWDEMIQAFKDVTSPDEGIYGFNQFHPITAFYPIAANPDAIGEFGWNGREFDMSDWAVGMNTLAELTKGKYRAPLSADELIAWQGSTDWAARSGKLGFQIDGFWCYLETFDTDEFRNKGIEFVPYATPSVEGNDTKYKFGVLDFGGISSGTEYPREAYELLKFMGWGLDGWKYKLEGYRILFDEEANAEVWRLSMPCPLTMDDDIWTEYQSTFYPTLYDDGDITEKDEKYGKYFDDFFAEVRHGVLPFGACEIPGFAAFIAGAYAGVEDAVVFGESNASDYVAELTQKANEYNRQAMLEAGLTPAE